MRFPLVSGELAHLSTVARAQILDPTNELYLSVGFSLGDCPQVRTADISLPSHPSTLIPAVREDSGIASLSLTEMDALAAEKLQLFHKDPFGRMLIAQALMGGL